MTKTFRGLLAACTALALLPAAAHAEDTGNQAEEDPGVWRLGLGANYSEGDYGAAQKTRVVSAPVSLRYRKGGFSIRLSVPYVHIDGPGSLLDTPQGRDAGFGDDSGFDDHGGSGSGSDDDNSGSGSSGSGSGSSGGGSDDSGGDDGGSSGGGLNGGDVVPLPGVDNRRGGLGDVSVALGYSFELGRTTWFDLSTRVKLPTASTAKRLGTGKVDVTLGGDLVQDLGNASFYAGGRYRILGKPAGSRRLIHHDVRQSACHLDRGLLARRDG